jgi:hypothetical protein
MEKTANNSVASAQTSTANPIAVSQASDDSGQFVTLTSLLIVVALAMTLTFATVYAAASKGIIQLEYSGPKVVTLDVDRLIEAGLKANDRKGPSAEPKASAEAFQASLKKEVDRLSTDGYLVVNFRAVITGAKQTDVTDEMIERLGLNDKGSAK